MRRVVRQARSWIPIVSMRSRYSSWRGAILTWEVMAKRRGRPYLEPMTTATAEVSVSLRNKALIAATVLLGFLAYSLWVVAGYGYLGFLELARDHPWGMQMLIDLAIACAFGIGWMIADARKRDLAAAPFVVMTIFLGSVGLLAYVVRRGFSPRSS
jgi:hypothetical protein